MSNEASADRYFRYINEYIERVQTTDKYIKFIISKVCGYSIFVTLYKEETLEDLYKYVGYELENNGLNRLYIKSPLNEENLIERNSVNIKEFIKNKKIKPCYQVPAPIVYHFWVDDGKIHNCTLCNELD